MRTVLTLHVIHDDVEAIDFLTIRVLAGNVNIDLSIEGNANQILIFIPGSKTQNGKLSAPTISKP